MCGNNTIPKKQRLPKNPSDGQVPQWSEEAGAWIATNQAGGNSSYMYIAYADDNLGNGFTTEFSITKDYIAFKSTSSPVEPEQLMFEGLWFKYKGQAGENGQNGRNAFVHIAYADDIDGSGFVEVFDPEKSFMAIITNDTEEMPNSRDFEGLWFKIRGYDGQAGVNGNSAYLNIAYADDNLGNGFTVDFDSEKRFIAFKVTNTIVNPNKELFTGLWFNYKGTPGIDGHSSYVYIAYADDEVASGFTTTFDEQKDYVAILVSDSPLDGEDAEIYHGRWVRYKGYDGQPGADGVNSYVYIAYADDAQGNGFTPFFNDSKNFIAIRQSNVALTPTKNDFAGLWSQYKGVSSFSVFRKVLTGNYQIIPENGKYYLINPGAGNRTLLLENSSFIAGFKIKNTGSTDADGTLVIKNSLNTFSKVLTYGKSVEILFIPNGGSGEWEVIEGG